MIDSINTWLLFIIYFSFVVLLVGCATSFVHIVITRDKKKRNRRSLVSMVAYSNYEAKRRLKRFGKSSYLKSHLSRRDLLLQELGGYDSLTDSEKAKIGDLL